MENPKMLPTDRLIGLTYSREDLHSYFIVDRDGSTVRVPKNRAVDARVSHPLSAAFRILAAAFLGLAPAGLGTLLLAPLAVLLTVPVLLRRPADRADRVRIAVVWGIAAGLLLPAVPLSIRFSERFF